MSKCSKFLINDKNLLLSYEHKRKVKEENEFLKLSKNDDEDEENLEDEAE